MRKVVLVITYEVNCVATFDLDTTPSLANRSNTLGVSGLIKSAHNLCHLSKVTSTIVTVHTV